MLGGETKRPLYRIKNELDWFYFFIPEIRIGNRRLRCDYIGTGMAGPSNQEK